MGLAPHQRRLSIVVTRPLLLNTMHHLKPCHREVGDQLESYHRRGKLVSSLL